MNSKAFIAGYLEKTARNILPGGLADDKDALDLSLEHGEDPQEIQEEVAKGIGVEMEHTDDMNVAKEISEDHVAEIPDYYERLEEMEGDAEVEEEKDLGDPDPSDTKIILDFIASQDDLDDDTLHQLFQTLGVDPHEGEEIVYAVLQDYLNQHPEEADTTTQEREVEEDEEE